MPLVLGVQGVLLIFVNYKFCNFVHISPSQMQFDWLPGDNIA